MLLDHLTKMARNNAWSNHRLYAACAKLTEAEYRATRVSFFPTIPLTLSHILTVDWYYIDALVEEGRGYDVFIADEPFATLAELEAAQRASDRKFLAFCEGLTPADLERKVILDRREAGRFPETIAAILGGGIWYGLSKPTQTASNAPHGFLAHVTPAVAPTYGGLSLDGVF